MTDARPAEMEAKLERFRADFLRLRQEIAKVIVGQDEVVEGTLIAMVAGGHVLLEGVPGLGKTLLVRTIADATHLDFRRVQFTPDLMPADLVGTTVVAEDASGAKRFEFQKGPLFAHVVLADEINRATPKTQSALLESMQEGSVTVSGTTHALPQPYFVLATQNPLEMEGTYPLPEAQLDRFFFKLQVPFPTAEDLETILSRTTESGEHRAERIFEGEKLREMGQLARHLPIADDVRRHAIQLVMATHPDHPSAPESVRRFVRYGSSPRGAQTLVLGAKIRAILDSRFHVAREDLQAVLRPALRHRMILSFEGQAENVQPDTILSDLATQLGSASAAS